MERKRFYFEIENLTDGVVKLAGDEFHHMVNVMRLKVGDEVVLFCGDGFDYLSKIKLISKREAVCQITKTIKNESETGVNLTVFQALAKGDKLSLITQKLTEIGVSQLKVFESKFCDVKANTSRLDKLSKTIISASKQCGRSVLMGVNENVLSFKDVLELVKNYDLFLVAYEAENCNLLREKLKNVQKNAKIVIIVGPEGGFDKSEVEALKVAGAQIVSLGKRILRTETAPIFASSYVIAELENL